MLPLTNVSIEWVDLNRISTADVANRPRQPSPAYSEVSVPSSDEVVASMSERSSVTSAPSSPTCWDHFKKRVYSS